MVSLLVWSEWRFSHLVEAGYLRVEIDGFRVHYFGSVYLLIIKLKL